MTTQRTALLALLLSALSPVAARAADVPLPPPPAGTSLQASTAPLRGYTFGLLAGFLAQGDVASASLGVDVGRDVHIAKLRRAKVELHLPVRLSRPAWSGSITQLVGPTMTTIGSTEDTVWIAEGAPSARLSLPVAAGLAIHVQAGVGLAVTYEEHIRDEAFAGRTTERKLVLAPSIQGAVGLTYQLGERLEVVFQPLAVGARAKADDTTFSALWGLSYRL